MFVIAISPVRNPSVGDRFITAQRRRRSASRLCPDWESSLVLLLVWSNVFLTVTNDTCDTLKCSGKYAHHFCIMRSYCVCVYHVTDGTDTEKETVAVWVSVYSCSSRNSSCLSVRLFLFITKQQLFESQVIPVHHETAAVWVLGYSCLSRNSSCLSLRLFLFITKQQLFESQVIPVHHKTAAVSVPDYSCLSGNHLILLCPPVRLSVCLYAHNVWICPLVVSSWSFVFVGLFQVRRSQSVSRGFFVLGRFEWRWQKLAQTFVGVGVSEIFVCWFVF